MTRRVLAPIALAVALFLLVAAGAAAKDPPDTVGVFAKVPSPGYPLGVLGGQTCTKVKHKKKHKHRKHKKSHEAAKHHKHKHRKHKKRKAHKRCVKRVYVATSAGNPFHWNSDGERLFTYASDGRLRSSLRIDTMMNPSNMGLYTMAFDGEHRLYVDDMNSRVLRYRLDKGGLPIDAMKEYATIPPPYSYGDWYSAMWNAVVFGEQGNLYVTDNSARVWRIPPNGQPEIWFQDSRLQGGTFGGANGAAIGPDGKLYIAVPDSTQPGHTHDSFVYRLPLGPPPSPDDLEEFAHMPASPGEPFGPIATGLTFGKSGRMYLALAIPSGTAKFPYTKYTGQIQVIASNGMPVRRIESPLLDSPMGLAFIGKDLYIANSNLSPVMDPTHWLILKADVGEKGGIAPRTPRIGG